MSVRVRVLWTALLTLVATSAPAQTHTISGNVTTGSLPVEAARITLFDPGLACFFETRSDVTGAWSLTDVPSGTFSLGVAARLYDYVETTETITSDATFDTALLPESNEGVWSIIGSTTPEFLDATDIAVLLPNGRVFFCHDTTDSILFNPLTGTNNYPSGSSSAQGCMNGTLLGDGRLIFVGGQDGSDPGSFTDAVRWVKSWSTDSSWTDLPDLVHPTGRWYTGLARLNDGELLIMGGGTAPSAQRTDTCELFDLASETWSYTGSMLNPCEFPPSALLHTGKVLATWSPPQLYDPATGTWEETGDFVQPGRGWPGHSDHSVIVLSDGRALAIGTRSNDLTEPNMGEIYDPMTETWTLTNNADLVREQPEVVQLPDGRVFVGAGQASPPIPVPDLLGRVLWTDLYDPSTDSWRRVADMQIFREYHAVTLLIPDGRVITTGGTVIDFAVGPSSADIEAYTPPYLFRGVRPSIAAISETTLNRGATIELEITPATALTSVVLMGTEAVTHWVSGGVPRRLELATSFDGTAWSVTLPTDPDVVPLGHYMLFAMVDDIPSEAVIVNVIDEAESPFRRGDCNADGAINLADAIAGLGALFGGDSPSCDDACDTNDDGAHDIADAISLLSFLFSSGPAPLAPHPDCGEDPTQDGLNCSSYDVCL